MALVGVEDLGVDAEGVEGADAADAEQDLLAQPVLGLAAVEPVGDVAQVGRVLVDVGVEEVERHPADLGLPHPGDEGGAGQVDLHPDAVARGPAPSRGDRGRGSAPAASRRPRATGGSSRAGRRGRCPPAARPGRWPP